jgi:uncharacterized tellurite resistance protein B-like protein
MQTEAAAAPAPPAPRWNGGIPAYSTPSAFGAGNQGLSSFNPSTQMQPGVALPPKIPPGTPLTIPQAVQLMELRMTSLENVVKDSLANAGTRTVAAASAADSTVYASMEELDQVVAEYDERFQIMAKEVAQVTTEMAKFTEMFLQLQSYTMNVNKMLYEERVQLLSELAATTTTVISAGPSEETTVTEGEVAAAL